MREIARPERFPVRAKLGSFTCHFYLYLVVKLVTHPYLPARDNGKYHLDLGWPYAQVKLKVPLVRERRGHIQGAN